MCLINVESKHLMSIFCFVINEECIVILIKKRISRRIERNQRRWAEKER